MASSAASVGPEGGKRPAAVGDPQSGAARAHPIADCRTHGWCLPKVAGGGAGGMNADMRASSRAPPARREQRRHMCTFVLVHGGGDVGWYWHLVEAELRARGHDVVAPDLPGDDDSLTLDDYAAAVVAAVGDRRGLVVVAHSFGGFTAPLVAVRLPADALVFVAGMVPAPGEAPHDWWARTGHREAVREQAARDGGATGNEDPYVCFYQDVPRELAARALSKERAHPSAASTAAPWSLDALPDVRTHFVLCTEDRVFPPDFLRRVVL